MVQTWPKSHWFLIRYYEILKVNILRGPCQAQVPNRLLHDVILSYIHLRWELVWDREGAFAVTNSCVTVYVSHWISFYFFSSSDLHKHFSLLDDT